MINIEFTSEELHLLEEIISNQRILTDLYNQKELLILEDIFEKLTDALVNEQ